jgi:hypothetical protein
MRWIRARLRFGGRLALFALAVQLVASFAHVHPEDFAHFRQAAVASTQTVQVSGDDENDHHPSGHDICAICAVIHLANALLTSAPPKIALPKLEGFIWHAAIQQQAAGCRQHAFEARAPPQA